jgi:hypothetical protein
VRAVDLVLIGQLARALGWPTARVRGLDDLLKPIRLSDGSRAYNVDRAMGFVKHWDAFMAWSDARAARERRRLRQGALIVDAYLATEC